MVGAWSAAVCSWVKAAWWLSAIGMVGAVGGCRDTPSGAATAAAPPIVTVAKLVTQMVTDYLTFPAMRAHSPALREGLHEGRGLASAQMSAGSRWAGRHSARAGPPVD